MDNITLNNKKSRILLLEKEIKELEKKKKQLERLRLEYYHDYFDLKRDDFTLLIDAPSNPIREKHILRDYSVLNIDTIGKIICILIKKYDKEDCIAERMIECGRQVDAFEDFVTEEPILVIGKKDKVKYSYKNENNIVICYDKYYSLEEYPTNNPVSLRTRKFGPPDEKSNYSPLVDFIDGLTFDYHNREYIRDLIYSLAYYQKVHDIKQMTPSDTWDIYRRIYYKK